MTIQPGPREKDLGFKKSFSTLLALAAGESALSFSEVFHCSQLHTEVIQDWAWRMAAKVTGIMNVAQHELVHCRQT